MGGARKVTAAFCVAAHVEASQGAVRRGEDNTPMVSLESALWLLTFNTVRLNFQWLVYTQLLFYIHPITVYIFPGLEYTEQFYVFRSNHPR